MTAPGGNSAGGFADLALRATTGVTFGAVVMAALLMGGYWFTLLIAALGAMMAFEWRKISLKDHDSAVAGFQVLAVIGATILAHYGDVSAALVFLLAMACAGAAADIFLQRNFGWGFIGALYIGFATICLVAIRSDTVEGRYVIYWVAMVVITTDIGAYFSGRLIGGPKLWPRVSPNKTWAGLIGAMTFAAVASIAYSHAVLGYIELFLPVLAAITAGVAQIGDLAESAYKRLFGVKDSGFILPGHGGVLDRLDGMIAATIFVAIITMFRGGAPIYQW